MLRALRLGVRAHLEQHAKHLAQEGRVVGVLGKRVGRRHHQRSRCHFAGHVT
jgi:hypothetical protein